eukprot:6492714-Amphidinium_carterae.2
MNVAGNRVVGELQSELRASRDRLVEVQQRVDRDRLDYEEELRLRDEALSQRSQALERTPVRSTAAVACEVALPPSGMMAENPNPNASFEGCFTSEPSFACLPTVREVGNMDCASAPHASRVPIMREVGSHDCASVPLVTRSACACACASPTPCTRLGSVPPGFEMVGRQETNEGLVARAFRGSGPLCAQASASPVQDVFSASGINMSGRTAAIHPQIISASASTGSGIGSGMGGVSWFAPSETVGGVAQVQTEIGQESSLEVRRDRSKLPDFEIITNTDPVTTIHTFETWLLRCSTAISTWCKNPIDAVVHWEQTLQEASRRWVVWSASSPTERRMEVLNRPLTSLGKPSVNVASTAFEAVLRSDLLERVPKGVVP